MQEYEAKRGLYTGFMDALRTLVGQILQRRGIKPQIILTRLKDAASLQDKAGRPRKYYSQLSEITDVVGLRVVMLFPDEIDKVAGILETEFDLDRANCVDKRTEFGPHEFGYSARHLVVSLRADQARLPEYEQYAGLKAEIQAHTIMGHAWAEMEHDRVYKSATRVDREAKRRFARKAAVIEEVEVDFQRIRDELWEHEQSVSQQITRTPGDVFVTPESLMLFARGNSRAQLLDTQLSAVGNAPVQDRTDFIESVAGDLQLLKLTTITEVEKALEQFGDLAARVGSILIARDKPDRRAPEVRRGAILSYLCYAIVARDEGHSGLVDYLDKRGIEPPETRPDAAHVILDAYERASRAGKDSLMLILNAKHEAGSMGPRCVFVSQERLEQSNVDVKRDAGAMRTRLGGATGWTLDIEVRQANGSVMAENMQQNLLWLTELIAAAQAEFGQKR